MKKVFAFSMLAALMIAASCGDSNDEAVPQEPVVPNSVTPSESTTDDSGRHLVEGSLVGNYFEPNSLSACFYSQSQRGDYLVFAIIPQDRENWDRIVNFQLYIEDENVVKEYSKYYGDTTYRAWHFSSGEYQVCTFPLNSISITADRDFDSEHPAGSLLNDLFVLEYSSAYDVIKSGYDPALDKTNDCWGGADYEAYQQMPLTEFTTIQLIHRFTYLHFTKLPETLGEYTFTISYNFGTDPVTGREAKKIAPAVVKAEFTDKDYVSIPAVGKYNKGE